MARYPYTIESGHGEQLTFLGVTHGPHGDRIEVEGVAQPGAGPPMHVHYRQEEAGRVVSGLLGYQLLGGEEVLAGPGELVIWPAGTPHRWWNAGTSELRFTGWCTPPGNVEFFLTTLFASTKESRKGRPRLFDAAFLMTRYRAEYAMLEMPPLVRKVVMPLLFGVGHVLGMYRKYKGAPPPLVQTVVVDWIGP